MLLDSLQLSDALKSIYGGISFDLYKPAGDGTTDDSGAWNSFIADVANGPRVGRLPPGTFYIPNATTVQVKAPIVLVGPHWEATRLLGRGNSQADLFRLVSGGLVLYGLGFRALGDIVVSGSQWAKSDFDEVSIERCGFFNVKRPLAGHWPADAKHNVLSRLSIMDNRLENAWGGFYWRGIVLSAVADGNMIRNLDGTQAGYRTIGRPGAPFNEGWSQGFKLGETESLAIAASCRSIIVRNNHIENLSDQRNFNVDNAEVHGVVVGADYYEVSGNTIRDLSSLALQDGEGIYTKGRSGLIRSNKLVNACCGGEAMIAAKGTVRVDEQAGKAGAYRLIVAHNQLFADNPRNGMGQPGIVVYTEDTIISENILEGCGGHDIGRGNKEAAIATSHDIAHNIAILHNEIYNAPSRFGIQTNARGRNLRVEGNVIDGVTGALWPMAKSGSTIPAGIAITPVDTKMADNENWIIARNQISRIGNIGSGSSAILFGAAGSVLRGLVIRDNRCDGTPTRGLLGQGSWALTQLTLVDNDFSASAAPINIPTGNTGPKFLLARGNFGFLEGKITFNPGTVRPNTSVQIRSKALPHAAPGDAVIVAAPYDLAGCVVQGYVKPGGYVMIVVANLTTANVTLPSGVWTLFVEKRTAPK